MENGEWGLTRSTEDVSSCVAALDEVIFFTGLLDFSLLYLFIKIVVKGGISTSKKHAKT